MKRALLLGLMAAGACTPPPRVTLPSRASYAPAAEVLAKAEARRPERYKMVHQVLARYEGQEFVMTGYMLGKRNGDFRVSASAAVGPQLFDVARVGGVFSKSVHFAPLAQRLDALQIARAIDRIFVAWCETEGTRGETTYVYECPRVGDEEADTLRVELDPRTFAPVRKVFKKAGLEKVTVTYDKPRPFGEEWLPTRIHLQDGLGYTLDIAVSQYEPGHAFGDELLQLPPEGGAK